MRHPRAYADPYLAGVFLGVVLLASFVVAGRGLGASGAFATSAAGVVKLVSPGTAAANGYFSRYLSDGGPWRDWLLFELAGVAMGGYLSARFSGRLNRIVDRGAGVSRKTRLAMASSGGLIMGAGAMLARGCTSGLALTGGALLSAGSWLFMLAMFAATYLAFPLVRKVWA